MEDARLRGEAPTTPDSAAGQPVEASPPKGRRTPPRWAKTYVVRRRVRRPRKQRASVHRRRRQTPDRRVVYALDHCPHCASVLRRGRVVRRRQVIEAPLAPVEVVDHVVLERRCPGCGAHCRGALPDLSDQVGAHRRVSWRVAALVAVLRTKLRLPVAQVQWLLAQIWGLRLPLGALCALLDEAARAARPAYEALLAEARASPVVHLDETGWRQDGRNGWVWTITTRTVRLFRFATSRAGAVARALLGTDAEGVIVSDFSTAYDQLDGRRQRCWAHLPRDIHDLIKRHSTDVALRFAASAKISARTASDTVFAGLLPQLPCTSPRGLSVRYAATRRTWRGEMPSPMAAYYRVTSPLSTALHNIHCSCSLQFIVMMSFMSGQNYKTLHAVKVIDQQQRPKQRIDISRSLGYYSVHVK